MLLELPKDGTASDQVVGGVKAPKPITGTGPERGSPEMETETRFQALRGASGAKSRQCAKA